jgi:hypothetical protein
MAANISFNPYATQNFLGSFSVTSDGFIQGSSMDDPNTRYFLSGGTVATTETIPMWGGLPIQESIPLSNSDGALGGAINRATTNAGITGFTVFDQGFSMVSTTSSTAPSAGAGNGINFYRLGTGRRIPLQIDPALVSLDGGLITQQVSWDYTANRIVAYTSGTALPVKILNINTNSLIITYDSVNNYVNWTTGACALCVI